MRDKFISSVRASIQNMSARIGSSETVPLANLHLIVDGVRVRPETRGLVARFAVPGGAKNVWLASDAVRPCDIEDSGDERSLGVCVSAFVLDDGFAMPITVRANDLRLGVGFHAVEDGMRRWTTGWAALPNALWQDFPDGCSLRVYLAGPPLTTRERRPRQKLLLLEGPRPEPKLMQVA